ncbi:MAG: hypothetical protein ABIA04_05110 [Pseudomonadota bacterium]
MIFSMLLSFDAHSWTRHDGITYLCIKDLEGLNNYSQIKVEKIEEFIKKAFSDSYRFQDFVREFDFNEEMKLSYLEKKDVASALDIISLYSAEPDSNMDLNLKHPDQIYMGGSIGDTAKGFRHLYFKTFNPFDFRASFHVPFRELGMLPERAQVCNDLSQLAFKAGSDYWGFRFLAWSLHYLQDITNPLHSTQIPTFKMAPVKAVLGGFKNLIRRSSQVIANYHYLYEDLIFELLTKDKKDYLITVLQGDSFEDFKNISVYLKAKAIVSSKQAYDLGNSIVEFFGKEYFEEGIDVPNNPKAYPINEYLNNVNPDSQLIKVSQECLRQCGLVTRSLVKKAIDEINSK